MDKTLSDGSTALLKAFNSRDIEMVHHLMVADLTNNFINQDGLMYKQAVAYQNSTSRGEREAARRRRRPPGRVCGRRKNPSSADSYHLVQSTNKTFYTEFYTPSFILTAILMLNIVCRKNDWGLYVLATSYINVI